MNRHERNWHEIDWWFPGRSKWRRGCCSCPTRWARWWRWRPGRIPAPPSSVHSSWIRRSRRTWCTSWGRLRRGRQGGAGLNTREKERKLHTNGSIRFNSWFNLILQAPKKMSKTVKFLNRTEMCVLASGFGRQSREGQPQQINWKSVKINSFALIFPL